jgi:hypothetical protein
LDDLGLDGRVLSKWILKKCVGEDWIHFAQDRDQWLDLVNTAVNLLVP